jgi:F420-non-reducing hydrogenase iron-sulfur subunit
VEYVQRTLKEIDIEPDRVQMYNLSSAQGPRFAEIATEMTEKTKELGPSPLKPATC